ncbi:Glutaredoxin [Seminavis robusta]|uniref:Glutaredoxin n=1 Tax=Seminavis robusta TaxID=568900 RepID=A0A9N8DQJ8_9STRA|nr:Glutaredoxin [Seminavis robusta]|eukprot:Sro276_g105920.1 Glutaredoxin (385) ;mRNA; f:20392-21666
MSSDKPKESTEDEEMGGRGPLETSNTDPDLSELSHSCHSECARRTSEISVRMSQLRESQHKRRDSSQHQRRDSSQHQRRSSSMGFAAAAANDLETFEQEMPEPGEVITISSLQDYNGGNVYQKLDSFIAQHDCVMVNRSWCLFSIDALDFMTRMGVDVYSIEVDNHPHGEAIVKYLKQKLEHSTSPWIFIKGDFVGGYEDVNTLYSKGTLQKDYLSKLTQADRCELMAAKSTTKPLFWFPVTVNAHAVRSTGIATSLLAATAAIMALVVPPVGQIIAYYLVLDFILRIVGGARWAPVGIIAAVPVKVWEPKPRSGRPKQFASMCGFMFSFLGSVFYLIPFPYHDYIGSIFIAILAICCGMEGFLDFCLGCVFFRIGLQLGLIPK